MKLLNTTEFIIGGTGTGKTYLAASLIKSIYDSKSRPIFTNVLLHNGFDEYIQEFDKDELYEFAKNELMLYKKFQKLSKEHKIKEQELEDNEDEIYNNLLDDKDCDNTDLEDENEIIKDDENSNDKQFNENDVSPYIGNYDNYLKASGLLDKFGNSMIVWDECQEDLQEDGKAYFDAVWGRFFSYRRHYGIHIILMTQDFDLIHRKYKRTGDKFYFAQNAARRYFSTMLRFDVYFKPQEYNKYKIETQNILMNKEIQNFYDTGEKDVNKSVFGKLLFIPVAFILIIYMGYQFFMSRYDTSSSTNDQNITIEHKDDNSKVSKSTDIDLNENEFSRSDDDHIMFFYCTKEHCNLRDNSFTIPVFKLSKFATAVDMEILYSSKVNSIYSLVVVNVTSSLYNELMRHSLNKKGDKHENGKMDFNNPVDFK